MLVFERSCVEIRLVSKEVWEVVGHRFLCFNICY